MNAALKIALGFGLVFALSACSQDTPEKKVDDLNGKIARLNAISSTLHTEGLPLQRSYSGLFAKREIPSGLGADKVTYLRGLLNEFVSLGEQVIAGSKDKDVFFTDSAKLQSQIDAAKEYLRQLQGYETREAGRRESESREAERRRETQKRESGQRDRKLAENAKLRAAMLEVVAMRDLQLEIKRRYDYDATEPLQIKLSKLDTKVLENLREDTRKALAHGTQAHRQLKNVSEPLLDAGVVKNKRDVEKSLTAHIAAMEINLSLMNAEISRRTGEPRPDMDRARPRQSP